MEEKIVKSENQFEKHPYSFELRINDNIVCQRYFKINGFKEKSIYSTQLINSLRYCAKLIKDDLKSKTALFLDYTAPQIFKNEDEMNEWVKQPRWELEVPSFIILEDEDKTFVWNGEGVEPYDKYFNRYDYLPRTDVEQTPCVLKLVFLVNDKEVCSTSWDGNVYPRFIRTNIDLSNSKNKYKNAEIYSPFESSMVEVLNSKHTDLIPVIVRELCTTCSYDNDSKYDVTGEYGDKKYNFNMNQVRKQNISEWEKACRKKTNEYFSKMKVFS